MIRTVENFLYKYNIKDKTVILGFSAGADSCTLALLLNQLKKKHNLNLILAYYNHNWRKEAILEEEFTKEFAAKINCQYIIKKAPENEPQSEENARILRYNFFNDCAREYSTDVVFLAHNKNDNIETLIYRIIKGTSIKGLTSIPEVREIYYRPLLEIEKKDILNYLKENNQDYRFDSSNNDIKYKRNLIRHKILPLFNDINPNYINNINILIKNAVNTRIIVDKKIDEIEKTIIDSTDNSIKKDSFSELDISIRLEIINNYLGKFLKYRDCKNLIKFDNFIQENKDSNKPTKTSINSDLFLNIKRNRIFITSKQEQKNSKENN